MIRTSLRNLFRSIVGIGFLLILFIGYNLSQTPNQVNDPTNPLPDYVIRNAQKREEFQRSLPPRNTERRNGSSTSNPSFHEIRNNAMSDAVWPGERRLPKLSRSDLAKIGALMRPDPNDVAIYKELLDKDGTGIFRLFPDSNCETKYIIRIDGECSNHVPGGSMYSFKSGVIPPVLRFNGGQLVGEGFFSQVVITELGDLPIQDPTSAAGHIEFLNAFVPSNSLAEARRQYAEIAKGISSEGRMYSNKVSPKLDTTYAMRMIAYRNKNDLTRRRPRGHFSYDHPYFRFRLMQAGKRFDVTILFRIIRREADGNLTIAWKEIRRTKSPVITFDKNEPLSDLK